MRLTLFTLTSPGHPHSRLSAPVIVDVLWAAAAPGDRIEHISARSAPRHIDIGIYTRRTPEQDPDPPAAEGVVRRALASAPLLRGWTLSTGQE